MLDAGRFDVPRTRESATGMALVDAQLVAAVRRTIAHDHVQFDLRPYRALTPPETGALDQAAKRYGEYLGLTAQFTPALTIMLDPCSGMSAQTINAAEAPSTRRMSSRAGAPPSPRALPGLPSGCSRQRESSLVRETGGTTLCFCARWVPRGTLKGSPRPGRATAVAVAGSAGVHAAVRSGVLPAAMAGSLTCRVMTTCSHRSNAAAQAVRACWRASRLSSRVVRWVNLAAMTGLFGSAALFARRADYSQPR